MRSASCVMLLAALLTACSSESPNRVRPAPKAPQAYPEGISAVTGFAPAPRDFPTPDQLKKIRADGFHFIRYGLPWDRIEVAAGQYDWAAADELVNNVRAAGMAVIWTLKYGNPRYPPEKGDCAVIADNGDDYRCPPAVAAPFAAFATAAAAHFGARVDTYEIWNEANAWYRFWPVSPGGDPAALAKLTIAAANAVRSACPHCTVLLGGLVYHDVPALLTGQNAFFTAMRAAEPELFMALDGIGFHHYTAYPPAASPERDDSPEQALEHMLADTHTYCDCSLPIWITETGWPTTVISEDEQALYALRGLLIALSTGVKSWIWWSVRQLRDQTLIAAPEADFGLRTADDQPRPGYTLLAGFLARYGDAVQVRDARGDYGITGTARWVVELTQPTGAKTLVVWEDTREAGTPIATLTGRAGTNLLTGNILRFERPMTEPVALDDF